MPATNVAKTIVDLIEQLLGKQSSDFELPVRLEAWDGSVAGPEGMPRVVLRSRRALRTLLWAPNELGLARAYVSGDLDVRGDLVDGLRRFWVLARRNNLRGIRLTPGDWAKIARTALSLGVVGPRPAPPAEEARLSGRLHTRGRDRQAIAHHYDLSNDFYRLLLDESMAYSSGYWTSDSPEFTLADSQRQKLDLICRKLGLQPGMRMLDIGCGWGSLILHAAQHYGVHVTGVTLSTQQRDYVQSQIDERGLGDKVTVRLQDYREINDEPFDAMSSIEMGEHVGEDNYPTYVSTMFRLLKPTGRLLLQQMSRGKVAPGGGAFIESYIAPDMTMRPVHATVRHLTNAGFELRDVEALREHYVRTIEAWGARLEEDWDTFLAMVGPNQARIWRLYMAGSALAFEENRMGVDQFLLVRTTDEGRSAMLPTRQSLVTDTTQAEA